MKLECCKRTYSHQYCSWIKTRNVGTYPFETGRRKEQKRRNTKVREINFITEKDHPFTMGKTPYNKKNELFVIKYCRHLNIDRFKMKLFIVNFSCNSDTRYCFGLFCMSAVKRELMRTVILCGVQNSHCHLSWWCWGSGRGNFSSNCIVVSHIM